MGGGTYFGALCYCYRNWAPVILGIFSLYGGYNFPERLLYRQVRRVGLSVVLKGCPFLVAQGRADPIDSILCGCDPQF